ncbi:ATP-binding protein [Fredinandcohnia sp. 179-A 10B2 NHS]|uniref:ATP-binding protein n=1 Tax=Fredinandcohnia sp. 179-A 10B2 NHS TaxID=3235176 RepID=UPI00399F2AB6
MNKQIEYIGRKIQDLNKDVMEAIKIPIGEDNYKKPKYSRMEFPRITVENVFVHIGEYLMNPIDELENNLITCVENYGLFFIQTKASLDQSFNFVYHTRSLIMEMLKEEVLNESISINCYFEVISIIENIYQIISKTLMNMYNEELSVIKLALDESKEDLRMTLSELADLERALNEATIFAITDREDKIIYPNDNFCQLYKYTREELIGKKHDIYSSNFHPPSFFDEIWNTIQGGEVWKGEILNQAKDGTKYWLDTTIIPFVDANGERYKHISIQYDITEKRNTEEALRKTEKLAMIGELAAGIAHEIRNPLTTVRGFIQLLNGNGTQPQYVNTILDEIDRINFIVSEFMVFAKPHQIYYSDCDLKSILTSVVKFLEPEAILKNINIEYSFPLESIVISGEKNQLKQVFLNLLKNSIEAMPTGGNIFISVERVEQNFSITIKDEGIGMAPVQLQKLGEPFFTTKQEGNGLGLMVSYKIIQNHRGTIQVDSQLNQGTTFYISFESPVSMTT